MTSQKPKIFLDADVIFAGSAAPSEHSASHVVLRMSEITLLECITSQQAITEVERNLTQKLPRALPAFRLLVSRCLQVVPDPSPEMLMQYAGQADAKDLPILTAAVQTGCSHLLTFNLRHYSPKDDAMLVQRPGEFLQHLRRLLSQMNQD
jgi:predicted nucleic acid-binding protein